MPSFVWNHFVKLDKDNARCKEANCTKKLVYSKGIRSLVYHLKADHNITGEVAEKNSREAASQQDIDAARKRQKTLHELDFLVKPSLEEEVSKLIAVSNFSFNQVATTPFIRESLKKKYPDRIIPKGHQGVSDLMMKFHRSAESQVKEDIKTLKASGMKFSVTLDEWTSFGNHRYMDINIHYKASADGKTAFINLGLFQINGNLPATRTFELVRILRFFFG